MSIVAPAHSPSRRGASSSASIRPFTAATPASTRRQPRASIRRARPAAVVEASPGTGVSTCPVASARWRSRPTRKSSPANCAVARPTSSSPAPNPRARDLIGPTSVSIASITPSRSNSSVTETSPAFGVNDGSGAPIHTRLDPCFLLRILVTTKVPFCPVKSRLRLPRFSLQDRHFRHLTRRTQTHYSRNRV